MTARENGHLRKKLAGHPSQSRRAEVSPAEQARLQAHGSSHAAMWEGLEAGWQLGAGLTVDRRSWILQYGTSISKE